MRWSAKPQTQALRNGHVFPDKSDRSVLAELAAELLSPVLSTIDTAVALAILMLIK